MKKLLAIILCLGLAFTVIGCKGDTDTGTSSCEASSTQGDSDISGAQVWFSKDGVELTRTELDKAINQEYVKPKNVIIMIGDGMGLNDIALANKFSDFLFDYGISFENLPNTGNCITNSLDGVTDSAASATALSSGIKTTNGRIGREKGGKPTVNVCEVARENGKKVGIVTNDAVYGATPSAFTVHNVSRSNTDAISRSFVEFAPDVLIGSGYSDFTTYVTESEKHTELLQNINVAPTYDLWEIKLNQDVNGEKPFFGFMSVDFGCEDYKLAQATELALNRLENENGFFLMVEGAGCDKGGHGNVIEQKTVGVSVLDKAVAVAIKYCLKNPDTVLIVTSDHETGGVTLPSRDYELTDDLFTTDDHTGVNVGVFALGYGTEYFNDKTVDNTDIGKFMIAALKGETYK